MLQVARLAPKLLQQSAENVESFVRSRQAPDGGFLDRLGEVDLYYTVFGLACLESLQTELPLVDLRRYLGTFVEPFHLDFVHLTSLARLWASLPPEELPVERRAAILDSIASYRTDDGGFPNAKKGVPHGTAYGAFLGLGAYQDLGEELPDSEGFLSALTGLALPDGSYANERGVPAGVTTATAGVVAALRNLRAPVPAGAADWLLARFYPEDGGFFAAESAPVPDLLSTATALHALSSLESSFDLVKEPCLDFLDTLWSSKGGFHGNWTDEDIDCEYTYYALLALGHLTL